MDPEADPANVGWRTGGRSSPVRGLLPGPKREARQRSMAANTVILGKSSPWVKFRAVTDDLYLDAIAPGDHDEGAVRELSD